MFYAIDSCITPPCERIDGQITKRKSATFLADLVVSAAILAIGVLALTSPHIFHALHLPLEPTTFLSGPGKWIFIGAGSAYLSTIIPRIRNDFKTLPNEINYKLHAFVNVLFPIEIPQNVMLSDSDKRAFDEALKNASNQPFTIDDKK